MNEKGTLPFTTATIAQLYMAQGKLAQAEALFRQLLKDNPEEARLTTGLAEVIRRREAGGLPLGADRVELESSGPKLHCKWNITEEGRQRAQENLGGPGLLILRLIAFPQQDLPPQDISLATLLGAIELDLRPFAALIAASVGLQDKERFVSIAHCTFSPKI